MATVRARHAEACRCGDHRDDDGEVGGRPLEGGAADGRCVDVELRHLDADPAVEDGEQHRQPR